MNEEKDIVETTVDGEEFFMVPKSDYELVEEGEFNPDSDENESNGVSLSGVLVGAGLATVVGLIGFGIKKGIHALKKRKRMKNRTEEVMVDADYEVPVIDAEDDTEDEET